MTWLTAFLDLPADAFDETVAFWCGVTGYGLSPVRGDHDEFATLVPPSGDAYLRVQRLGDGPARVHLDLHEPGRPFSVQASPGGFPWCEVGGAESVRPPAATWPGGHRSQVDQVSLDIPADRYEEECAWWSARLGHAVVPSASYAELRRLDVPSSAPLRVLLQRLDEPTGPVRAHLDLATTDRDAETARHVALGAQVVDVRRDWTVLRDPAGSAYCITHRTP